MADVGIQSRVSLAIARGTDTVSCRSLRAHVSIRFPLAKTARLMRVSIDFAEGAIHYKLARVAGTFQVVSSFRNHRFRHRARSILFRAPSLHVPVCIDGPGAAN
jgi:hypothetical protein